MKTIKQIADEIGVSKQAIHQKRKGKELSTALQPFTSTVDGVVYISVDGENLIKSAFSKITASTVDVNVDGNQNELYSILKAELDAKNKQIDEQQKTIQKLTDALNAQAQSINADRHNVLAETLLDGHGNMLAEAELKPLSIGFTGRLKNAFKAIRGV
jgi:polyribonucleotide nucleotidyltransferase